MTRYTKFILYILLFSVLFSCGRDSASGEQDTDPTTNPPGTGQNDGVTTANVRTYMTDKNATDETVALFYNLYKNAGSKILLGHEDAFYSWYQDDSSESDVKKATGSDPAMIGLDFMFITDKNYEDNSSNWYWLQEKKITDAAKEAYSKGMAVTFCWHLREPFEEKEFYASNMTEEQKTKAFKSILPGGQNNDWYKKKLDKVASVLSNLKGSDGKLIPVIFRPFHEFDGSWFWWGASFCTPAEYQQVWQFTVNYLRDTKNVHNVLYAYSPDQSYANSASYLQRYPGDAYVDILGMDNYEDFKSQNASGVTKANGKLKMISDLGIEKKKIAALTETGYSSKNSTTRIATHFTSLVFPAITDQDIKIAYINFWSNSKNEYYVPTKATPYADDFDAFTSKAKIVLQRNIGSSIYKLP